MDDRIESLLEKIKDLDNQLVQEMQKKQDEYLYRIIRKKVRFQREVRKQHKLLVLRIRQYLRESDIATILTAPVIWFGLLPAVFMDLFISFYQWACFPVYGIPKVQRSDYIVLDRHYLSYLNGIEKFNCAYCGYFNGLAGYVREVVARTEQYWCPIKHARRVKAIHSRYRKFFEYGDAKGYRENIETVRRDFKDIK